MNEQLLAIVGACIVSNLSAGAVVLITLRVHVEYLRKAVAELRESVDTLERRERTTRALVMNEIRDN